MSDSGFVPPREWHWSAWLLLTSATLFGLILGYWFARVQYRFDIEDIQKKIAEEQQTAQLGNQIGSVNEDLQLRQSFRKSYRELQDQDIENLASEKFEEQKLEYEAERMSSLQLMQSEANEAYVLGKWTDPQDGAAVLYRNILQLEPDHSEALERIDLMAERFLQRSAEFEEKDDLSAAMGYALNSLDIKLSEEAVARVEDMAQKMALDRLTGQSVEGEAKEALELAESKLSNETSASSDIKEGVDAINQYRGNLGVNYTPEWAVESAENVRRRALIAIENNPTSPIGYDLLQYATAIDGKYTSVPQIKLAELQEEKPTPTINEPAPVTTTTKSSGVALVNATTETATQERPTNLSNASKVWASGYKHYISGDYGLARADFEQAININNDPRAQFYLALMYGEGEGVQRNTVRSQQYLSQIAPSIRTSLDRNETWAQVAQGVMYEKGWMLQQNSNQALNSYTIAAMAGDIEAQYRLGKLLNQVGGTRANRTGAQWMNLAKSNGHSGD